VTSSGQPPTKRDGLWIASVVLAVIGLVDSLYLTWIKLANQAASCGLIGDCESVNNSRYAVIGGIPTAALGVMGYLVILVLLVLDRRAGGESDPIHFGLFGVTLAGTLFSVYLTYLEVFVLHAICPFCALSAVVMLGLFIVSLVRLRLWE
jgi:uncharacterized membrane protein